MASIGVVMFGKAVVMAGWIIAAERYQSYKEKRRSDGVTLKHDARRGIYYDPILRFEKRVKLGLWIIGVPLGLYTLLVTGLIIGPPLWAKIAG